MPPRNKKPNPTGRDTFVEKFYAGEKARTAQHDPVAAEQGRQEARRLQDAEALHRRLEEAIRVKYGFDFGGMEFVSVLEDNMQGNITSAVNPDTKKPYTAEEAEGELKRVLKEQGKRGKALDKAVQDIRNDVAGMLILVKRAGGDIVIDATDHPKANTSVGEGGRPAGA